MGLIEGYKDFIGLYSKILKFLPLVSRIMNEEPVILEFIVRILKVKESGHYKWITLEG